jgi:HAL2 family 3'(2'),5'-bisphosphate nucleotidase
MLHTTTRQLHTSDRGFSHTSPMPIRAHIDLDHYQRVAARATLDASLACRAVQAGLDDVRAITKDDRSPVTVADYASQAIVAHHLRRAFGDDLIFVGEEDPEALRTDEHAPHRAAAMEAVRLVWPDVTEAAMLDAIALGTDDPTPGTGFWTLDPVDGTKGFLRNQQYAVALAYVAEGAPVVGAMGCPNLGVSFDAPLDVPQPAGSLYVSAAGRGVRETTAIAGALDTDPQPIDRAAAHERRSAPGFIATASVEKAHSSVSDTDHILEHLRASGVDVAPQPARLDSQAKYSVVARGQADAYLRLPAKRGYIERIWDHAAGALIATEAGCVVSDIFGVPLDFGHGRGLEKNKGVICALPEAHAQIIDAIRTLGIGQG